MLTTLRIKNLALVADLTLPLAPGYNVITGETGAGKSILLGALNLILGERADRSIIRSGSDACSVEAVFDVSALRPAVKAFLAEHGLESGDADQLIVKRTLTAAGANRQFVNGSPTTLATLAALGERLVDMHGPHEHQSLLHPAWQLALLDAYANVAEFAAPFAALVEQRSQILSRLADLVGDDRTYAQQLDLLRHQVREIQAARLQPGEEAELGPAYQRATNAAKLLELGQAAAQQLNEGESPITAQLGTVGRTLQELKRLDPEALCLVSLQEEAMSFLRDLATDLSHYLDRIELEPSRLRELEDRFNLLQSLKRKYGGTVEDVIQFGESATTRLQDLEQRDVRREQLQAELAQLHTRLREVGTQLSAARRKAIPKLDQAISTELAALGFRQAQFQVRLAHAIPALDATRAVNQAGFDEVEFEFAPNPGEPARPLRAIASSGEMARVMLAIKTVLAAHDRVPVLVFDEVDANIGGETAHAVGQKMRQISRRHQVLCVTHLAPVAARAETHFAVTKAIKDGRSFTDIQLLEAGARVDELARMLGGVTPAARQLARTMLESP